MRPSLPLLLALSTALSVFSCRAQARPAASNPISVAAESAQGRSFFVSPTGTSRGDGSLQDPWDLQTALDHPAEIRPGDTIWLRGGTYPGTYGSYLVGTAASPVVVRQYPGERVTLDGGNSNKAAILFVIGSYTWFWGFEIMSSDPSRRTFTSGEDPPDIGRGNGFTTQQSPGAGVGVKFINMVIHDTRENDFWQEATDAEVYGCLIYYNGWEAPDRGHGHGLYIQNRTGTKKITDNILFSGFNHAIHAYGSEAAFLNDIQVSGNTLFNAGDLSREGGRNLLIGGGRIAENPVISDNILYRAPSQKRTSDFKLGYGAACTTPTIVQNYMAGSADVDCTGMTVDGNTFVGKPFAGISPSSFPDNSFVGTARPSGTIAWLRPNAFEPGRANLTILNWDLRETVEVDLSALLRRGASYEIRNAADFFGPPVATGVFTGNPVSIPMTGLSVAAPVGWPAPAATGPEFNAFVILPLPGRVSPTPVTRDPGTPLTAPRPASPGRP